MRANETLREIYWEALRAPDNHALFRRNPYRREKLIKRHLGRTKAERIVKKREIKEKYSAYMKQIETRMQEEANQAVEVGNSERKKRLEYAKKRAKLGFKDTDKDVATEGVEDPVLDKLTIDERKYQKMLADSRERKSVKIPVEVEGISKQEIHQKVMEIPGAHFKQ